MQLNSKRNLCAPKKIYLLIIFEYRAGRWEKPHKIHVSTRVPEKIGQHRSIGVLLKRKFDIVRPFLYLERKAHKLVRFISNVDRSLISKTKKKKRKINQILGLALTKNEAFIAEGMPGFLKKQPITVSADPLHFNTALENAL